jgi:hypothetical protein
MEPVNISLQDSDAEQEVLNYDDDKPHSSELKRHQYHGVFDESVLYIFIKFVC